MNIEFKKIAQHIVNGAKIKIENFKSDYVGVEFSKANGYYFLNDSLHVTYEKGSTGKSLKEFKFILRPLSDLDKEIKLDDGSRLYPLEQIGLSIDSDGLVTDGNEEYGLNYLYYTHIKSLLEWHFDIFGFIEKGLAISIHDVE